jgi:hypothetical protein
MRTTGITDIAHSVPWRWRVLDHDFEGSSLATGDCSHDHEWFGTPRDRLGQQGVR